MRVALIFLVVFILFTFFDRNDDEPQEEDWGGFTNDTES